MLRTQHTGAPSFAQRGPATLKKSADVRHRATEPRDITCLGGPSSLAYNSLSWAANRGSPTCRKGDFQ
jgi:hypothetical protein